MLLNDPFAKFETTRDETETVYLTKEEIQAIADKEIFNERLCRVDIPERLINAFRKRVQGLPLHFNHANLLI